MIDDQHVDPFSRPQEPTAKKPGSIRVSMAWVDWLSAAQAARAKKPSEEPPPQPDESPGLELFWQIYDALLPQRAWTVGVSNLSATEQWFYPVDVSPRSLATRIQKGIAGYRRENVRLVQGSPVGDDWKEVPAEDLRRPKSIARMVNRAATKNRSLYESILTVQHRARRRRGEATGRQLALHDRAYQRCVVRLIKGCPGLDWLLNHASSPKERADFALRLRMALSEHTTTRTSTRPAFQSPETLAIKLTAITLRKDVKSIERRVDLEDAPWSVSLRNDPRPAGYKVTRTSYQGPSSPKSPK